MVAGAASALALPEVRTVRALGALRAYRTRHPTDYEYKMKDWSDQGLLSRGDVLLDGRLLFATEYNSGPLIQNKSH